MERVGLGVVVQVVVKLRLAGACIRGPVGNGVDIVLVHGGLGGGAVFVGEEPGLGKDAFGGLGRMGGRLDLREGGYVFTAATTSTDIGGSAIVLACAVRTAEELGVADEVYAGVPDAGEDGVVGKEVEALEGVEA